MLKQILLALCFAWSAWAAEVQLAWDANTEPDLAGYRIHYGTESGSYTAHIDVGNVTTYTVPGLADQTRYYFVATSYDTSANESVYSNEVNWTSGEPPVYIGAMAIRASKLQQQPQEPRMPFSYIGAVLGQDNSGGTTLNASGTLNIAAGDVLIAWMSWEDGTSTAAVDDSGSNSFTMLTVRTDGSSQNYGCFGYILNAAANASAQFVFRNGTSRGYRRGFVMQFRPDSGETVTLDDTDIGSGSGTSMASGAITTTGDDEIVVGACKHYNTNNPTTERIGGVAAAGTLEGFVSLCGGWYQIYSATQTGITATATATASDTWICHIISIKSGEGGGTSAVPANRGNVGMMLGMSNAMWLDNDFIKPLGGN